MGIFLYAAAGILVAARMLLYPLRPGDMTPPVLGVHGATAITACLAGARIVQIADAPMVTGPAASFRVGQSVFWHSGHG